MTSPRPEDLAAVPLLATLPSDLQNNLLAFCSIREFRKGQTVFQQREPSVACFGVLAGEVTIQRQSTDSRHPPKMLGRLGVGQMFGESALFEDTPRSAAALASMETLLLVIDGKAFRDWLYSNREASLPLVMQLFRHAMDRLQRTSHQLSLLYSAGRILVRPVELSLRLGEWKTFLQRSLDGIDDIRLFQFHPLWDEYQEAAQPESAKAFTIPISSTLGQRLTEIDESNLAFQNPLEQDIRAQGLWPEGARMGLVILLRDSGPAEAPRGCVMLFSRQSETAFDGPVRLLAAALSDPLTAALARETRQEDDRARTRLEQARARYPL